MNQRDQLIIDEYRREKDDFERIGEIVQEKLSAITKDLGIVPMEIQHRVKSEQSLVGKLYRHADRYKSLSDLTDILGARVVLYFTDEVDIVGKKVEEAFLIDWENSTDKRAALAPDAFGYLSLHYIGSLKEEEGYPEELLGKRFEIQLRTGLQHIWSDIDHDLAYKSEFGVPREIQRGFSRLAGLLELADAEFVRVRDSMKSYTETIRKRIEDDTAADVPIDLVSLSEFMLHNREMRAFLDRLSAIEGSEIADVTPEAYLNQLSFLGITTLGQLSDILHRDEACALSLAGKALSGSELDILSSNVALRYLCRAYLMETHASLEEMTAFFRLSVKDDDRAVRQAKALQSALNSAEA